MMKISQLDRAVAQLEQQKVAVQAALDMYGHALCGVAREIRRQGAQAKVPRARKPKAPPIVEGMA